MTKEEIISTLCLAKDVNQLSLSMIERKTGIRSSDVSKILNGKIDSQLSTYIKIADAVGVSLSCVIHSVNREWKKLKR